MLPARTGYTEYALVVPHDLYKFEVCVKYVVVSL